MQNYVGKRLDGRYEIREIIGVGGMAVVYKAYDNIDDRIVAVKILKEEFLANEEFRRRFKNESKAIAVLSHMNIVKVFDVSYGDRLQYIVMEYVEGITLKEYIQQQGCVNHREAVFFVMQVLRALQHAHDKGIVHRDIKPQNILLLENGVIKVTDFGIARFFASDTRTMTDSAIGSVHYISPEQARGDATNDKADIYSVGVMLYEMLTGRVPFESDNTVSVAIMQLQKDPVKPRMINPQIPIGIEQIIMKAMQKNPLDRYQSAAEMLLDLEEFRRNPSIQFDYSYSNNEPTKYIPKIQTAVTAYEVEAETEEEDENESVERNRTIPILIGIVFALVILLAAGIGLGAHFGIIGDKVKVPNFVGEIYDQQVFAKEYDEFQFKVEYKSDSNYDSNVIISQDPVEGEKIDPEKQVINLVVAVGSDRIQVPTDLLGKSYVEVKNILIRQNIKVTEEVVDYSEEMDVEPGTVIAVSPEEGQYISANAEVKITYISYDSDNVELVKVPDVNGYTQADAVRILETSGFVVEIKHEYSETVQSDYVIGTSILKGTEIPKGSDIVLTISLGIMVEQSTEIKINLPDTDSYGQITVSLDGTNILTEDNRLLDGSEYVFSVNGHGYNTQLKVFVDGKTIYKCEIDFTTVPCTIKNESFYSFEAETTTQPSADETLIVMPDVYMMSPEEAESTLVVSGFKRENITRIGDGNVVISQFPIAGNSYHPDVKIELTLGDSN